MFGAVTAYLYDYLLGIRQPEDAAGYRTLEIAPVFAAPLSRVSGFRRLKQGRVDVSWEREGDRIRLTVTLPPHLPAVLLAEGERVPLQEGKNEYTVPTP